MTTSRRLARRMLRAFLAAFPQYAAAASKALAASLHSGVVWQAGGLRWQELRAIKGEDER